MKHIHLGFLLIGVMLILFTADVSACICMQPSDHPPTREENFNRYRSKAVTVFSGRVVSDKILSRRIKGTTSQFLSTRLNIRVNRFWGAPVPGEVFLIENMTSCDARLFAGESYLVFV